VTRGPGGGVTRAAWPGAARDPGAGVSPLRPRPTTGRVPKTRAERAKGGRGRLLAVLLVVGLLGVGVMTGVGGLLGGSVRVPKVVGLEVPEATRDLQSRGLRVRVGEAVASDSVQEGLVATQSIDGGEQARRQATVVLQPSLGITMPDLVRQPAGSATGKLRQLGIPVRRRGATSVSVPKGNVIETRPAKGTVLKADQAVTLVVSVGRPRVQVPDVAGQPLALAQAALAAAQFQVRSEQVFDDAMPAELVVGTDPGIGTKAPLGSTVVVRVSKGPDLVQVPEVVGLSREEATARLREAGLGARFLLPAGDRVIRQFPGPGEQVRRGSEIQLLPNLI
jgi:beta-lactam-binding protein with PASTA domain